MIVAPVLLACAALQAADTTPPSRIDDLVADSPDHGAFATLTWTTPQDDDGSAAEDSIHGYRIFYSAEGEITAATLASASEVTQDLPLPTPPRTLQTTKIHADLDYDTRYYFAMIAVDESGNEAAISNSPSAKTGSKCPNSATGSAAPALLALVLLAASLREIP